MLLHDEMTGMVVCVLITVAMAKTFGAPVMRVTQMLGHGLGAA